jgi:glycogen operon protein
VLSWVKWELSEFESNLETTFAYLTRLRSENASLRPVNFGSFEKAEPGTDLIRWYSANGEIMSEEDWNSSETRVIQRLNENIDDSGARNLTLLVINGSEDDVELTLPTWETVESYELLWDSANEVPNIHATAYKTGKNVAISECSVKLFRAVAL